MEKRPNARPGGVNSYFKTEGTKLKHTMTIALLLALLSLTAVANAQQACCDPWGEDHGIEATNSVLQSEVQLDANL